LSFHNFSLLRSCELSIGDFFGFSHRERAKGKQAAAEGKVQKASSNVSITQARNHLARRRSLFIGFFKLIFYMIFNFPFDAMVAAIASSLYFYLFPSSPLDLMTFEEMFYCFLIRWGVREKN
jgi:hypothetical protein